MNKIIFNLKDKLKTLPQFLIPQHGLSRIIYYVARCEIPFLKNLLIRIFVHHFKVDMGLACKPDITSYNHFNHFFTRELKKELRPIAAKGIACPVDGSISQIGKIIETTILQVKNYHYDLESLLTDGKEVEKFINGEFATLYLSPRDYHRIHMPIDGQLVKMIYVPGTLFSVNAQTTRTINHLFTRNERVVCLFETAIGPMAIIMVGAIFVGSMETIWAGQVTPAKASEITQWSYLDKNQDIKLEKGMEMGRFNMGSTVILLFGKDAITWLPEFSPDKTVIMGKQIGSIC